MIHIAKSARISELALQGIHKATEIKMATTTSRRTLLVGASMLPVASLPALAGSAPAQAATTLPPDLIDRFVRVRAWYLDNYKRAELLSDEIDRRFYAVTGLTAINGARSDMTIPVGENWPQFTKKYGWRLGATTRRPSARNLVRSDGPSPRLCSNTSRKISSISRGRQRHTYLPIWNYISRPRPRPIG